MAIRIDIFDGAIPMLDLIATTSSGFARQALTESGFDIREDVVSSMKTFRHSWEQGTKQQAPKNAYRMKKKKSNVSRYIWNSGTNSRVLGTMNNHKTMNTHRDKNIGNWITSYISPRGGYSLTIGGSHKKEKLVKYKDGKPNGTYAKAYGSGSEKKAIFHKLNTGEVNEDHPYFNNSGAFETAQNQYSKARNFMKAGRRKAIPKVTQKLTKYYGSVLPRVVNSSTVKTRIYDTQGVG